MIPNHILLVEDDQDDEFITVKAIQSTHIKNPVNVVRDGQEALEYLFSTGKYANRNKNDLPEVILLDLKLPKRSGLEVLTEIRNNPLTKLIPVIILTSSNEDLDKIQSYSKGANSFVRKPVNSDKFQEAVRQLSLYWVLINETPKK